MQLLNWFKVNSDRIIFGLVLLCLNNLVISFILVYCNPVTGFFFSIYNSTNWFVWFTVFFNIAVSLSVIILQVGNKKYMKSNLWVVFLFILLLTRFFVILIPSIKGVLGYHGDTLFHKIKIQEIVVDGFYTYKKYPIIHVLTAILSISINVDSNLVAMYVAPFISVFSVIAIYLLSKEIFSKKTAILATTLASITFSLNTNYFRMTPNGTSLLYIPFIFYLIYYAVYKRSFESICSLFITLIIYPLFHPISTLFLFISLIIFISYLIFNQFSTGKKKQTNTRVLLILSSCVMFLFIVYSYHIIINGAFIGFVKLFIESISISPSSLTNINETIAVARLSLIEFLVLLIKKMGDEIVYIALYWLSGIVLYLRRDISGTSTKHISLWLILLFPFLLFVGFFFGVVPGLSSISGGRMTDFFILLSPIFGGYILTYSLHNQNKLICCIVFVIVLSASLSSALDLFPSPYTMTLMAPLLEGEIEGLSWFMKSMYSSTKTYQLYSLDNFRQEYVSMIYPSIGTTRISGNSIPYHFNYTVSNHIGFGCEVDSYLFYGEYFKLHYLRLWPQLDLFNDGDFIRIINDYSVNRVYFNGDFESNYIRGY